MRPQFTTDIRFFKNTALFLLATKKQSIVQNRHRSIEKAIPYLTAFGYLVTQKTQVKLFFGGFQHLLIMTPWRKGVFPAAPYIHGGIMIGTTVVTQYEPDTGPQVFEPAHDDVRAALIWTPPIDVKRKAIPPVRYPTMSFEGMPDGSIDFEAVLKEWRKTPKEIPAPTAQFIEGGRIYG
jgi:hypothetical protein